MKKNKILRLKRCRITRRSNLVQLRGQQSKIKELLYSRKPIRKNITKSYLNQAFPSNRYPPTTLML